MSDFHGVFWSHWGGEDCPRQGWAGGQPSVTSGHAGHVSCTNDGAIHEQPLALQGMLRGIP